MGKAKANAAASGFHDDVVLEERQARTRLRSLTKARRELEHRRAEESRRRRRETKARIRELLKAERQLGRDYSKARRAGDRARTTVDFHRHYDEADRLQAQILATIDERRSLERVLKEGART